MDKTYDEISDSYYVECPVCGAEQAESEALLGSLGSVEHYRCRYCDARWHDTAE